MRLQKPLVTEEVYHQQTEEIMRCALRRSGTFVDVGCHAGKFLDVALRIAPAARHFGFEPLPAFVEQLRQRYAKWPNVTVQEVALSDTTGEASFVYNVDVPSHSGLRERDYPFPNTRREAITVPTRRLDDALPDTRVAMLAVDVEGGELLVLRGASRILREQRPAVVFEFGLGAAEHYGHGPRDVIDLFAEHGMRVFTLEGLLAAHPPLSARELEREYHAGTYYFAAHDPERALGTLRADDPAARPPEAVPGFPRKLNLGCGYDHRAGYLNVDLFERHEPDLVADVRDLSALPGDYFDEIIAHDVLEHLLRDDTVRTLAGWARLLRKGGRLNLRVPSFLHLAEMLLNGPWNELHTHEQVIHLAYGTQAGDGDFHLTSFTPFLLQHYLKSVGLVPQSGSMLDGWMMEVVAEKGAVREIDLRHVLGSRRALFGRLAKRLTLDRLRLYLPRRFSSGG
jgi:FkbM family methyltransferase